MATNVALQEKILSLADKQANIFKETEEALKFIKTKKNKNRRLYEAVFRFIRNLLNNANFNHKKLVEYRDQGILDNNNKYFDENKMATIEHNIRIVRNACHASYPDMVEKVEEEIPQELISNDYDDFDVTMKSVKEDIKAEKENLKQKLSEFGEEEDEDTTPELMQKIQELKLESERERIKQQQEYEKALQECVKLEREKRDILIKNNEAKKDRWVKQIRIKDEQIELLAQQMKNINNPSNGVDFTPKVTFAPSARSTEVKGRGNESSVAEYLSAKTDHVEVSDEEEFDLMKKYYQLKKG
jgi:hypothetical protein